MLWALLLAAAPAPTDWAATLRRDARALHDEIAANHPGTANRLDPGFARRNDAALAQALQRAARVHDRAGYQSALDGYAARFDDGHLATFPADGLAPLPAQWPGFLTGYAADGSQRVVTRAADAPVPLGARLIGCDGRGAERLAAENVGAFVGRWFLVSRRTFQGGRLFVDRGNPFVVRPSRCIFDVDGRRQTVAPAWQPIADDALRARLADTNGRAREPIGARVLADGTRWFTLSGFDGDPASGDPARLMPLIAAMRTDRAALAAAPRIVLDLRGNNGGSSDWSRQIAVILWGEARVSRWRDGSTGVDWRASPANIAWLAKVEDDRRADLSPYERGWFERAVTGMRGAQARGLLYWHEPADADAPVDAPPPPPLAGPVYLVTDSGCGSACLDAVDLWRGMGAIQVGQETGADTFYMDVRQTMLPSGQAGAVVPMKVYRGRTRGSNVPVAPVYPYRGDLRDTAALARWIAALPVRA